MEFNFIPTLAKIAFLYAETDVVIPELSLLELLSKLRRGHSSKFSYLHWDLGFNLE